MAERATADRVAADMKPPNYRGAVQRLRSIKPKKEKIAGINGEISGIYDTVEGFKVNKKAARIFLTLDPLESDERQDIMRSFIGLCEAAGWDAGDLVDQAEGGGGKVVAADFTGGRKGAAAAAPAASADENAAGEDAALAQTLDAIDAESGNAAAAEPVEPVAEPEKKPRAERLSPAAARKKAQEHFSKGEAPPPSGKAPEGEPYTGDNSDLAPE